jgi:thiamine-phosphate diphosphorylase
VNVPRLHAIATDDVVGAPGFLSAAEDVLSAGGSRVALHLRLREATGLECYELARRLSAVAGETGGWCVVNGRVDVALCAGSQAVQLGSGSLPIGAVRSIAGGRLAVGASVHSPREAGEAARSGADYVVAGSVFRTATHPDRDPAGPDLVRSCAEVGLPVIGIGGIDRANAVRVLEAGAAGVAVVRAVWRAKEPARASTELIELVAAWSGAR